MSAPKDLKDFNDLNDLKDPKDPNDFKDLKDVKDLKGFKEQYVTWLKDHAGGSFEGLRFAVDCSDGMAGILAHDLFGPDAVYLNDVPDGRFPHHSPNPLLAEAREQVSATVREKGLGEETGRSDIDGYRLEFAEGWVSVRQSNTEPLLRLLVECDTSARLASWRATLVAALQS